jgi:hypothetical protein
MDEQETTIFSFFQGVRTIVMKKARGFVLEGC